ncbi:MAG: Membrane protein insertase YidC [Candidatus Anoxychlamydiales bacterium]|nr:Membrane protein insertase YidC [Candidatus Anoxychlamydiales bacterium]
MDKRTIIFIIVLAASFYVMQLIFPPQKTQAPKTVQTETATVVKEDFKQEPIVQPTGKESFYVLENDFLQVVFSTKGGSISEINLPFKTKENQKSIVNEINFDREIKSQSVDNAKFPLNSYQIYEDGKIVEQKPTISGYYPLIRRHLVDHPSISPSYYSLNIVSDTDAIENANYKLTRLEKDLIEFELTSSNRRVTKTYEFAKEAPYTFDMSVSIDGDAKNLWLTSGVPEVELTSGRSSPVLKMRTYRKQKNVVDQLSLPKGITTVSSIYPDWTCNSNGFLGLIIDPLTEIPPGYRTKYIAGNSLPTRLTQIDQRYNLYPADKYPGYEMFLPLKSNGEKTNFRIFAGPFAKNILNAVDATYSNAITGYNPEYIKAKSFHGIFAFISEPFAKLMFSLMQLFHKTTASWGLSIILLTFVLRLMLYPLNAWSIKANTKMQEFAPKMKEIQKRYANNPQKQKMEMMKLYKEKGSNPLMGCFPMVIQIPFLLGMFDLLKSTFELRGASFIPGWINNLTAPDVVFSWGRPIPLIGTEFHLLPIIMGIVMYLQSKYMTKKPIKTTGPATDQERQQKALATLMPLIFTVIFYKMPSGLNIYYLFFSLFGILQQWIMNRKTQKNLMKT